MSTYLTNGMPTGISTVRVVIAVILNAHQSGMYVISVADPVWHYPRAVAVSNYDGDTITLLIDVGLSTFRKVTVRLARVNTPELKDANGAAAKRRTAELVAIAPLEVTTIKDKTEKYGRYLAEVINADGVNVADQLMAEGLGWPYEGGRR